MRSDRPSPLYGDLRSWALIHADSLDLMRQLPDACVGAVVTDPPYGLAFGDEPWDSGDLAKPAGFQAFSRAWATEARRVLRPGGHLVAFGATRTFHRLTAGVEDSGLEIRDLLLWLHGAGMPKSPRYPGGLSSTLKPTYEPILLARVPLDGATVRRTIEQHGTGALNIDAARLPRPDPASEGYWPSHVLLGHAGDCDDQCGIDCVVPLIDGLGPTRGMPLSRLFYAGKTARDEREAGLDQLAHSNTPVFASGPGLKQPRANVHPTVKPLDVMRWLVRLTVPVGGLVLDPFAGSGSTGCAAVLEGRQFIGIERESRYLPIARARLAHWTEVASIERQQLGRAA